jgi:hypothetical protein
MYYNIYGNNVSEQNVSCLVIISAHKNKTRKSRKGKQGYSWTLHIQLDYQKPKKLIFKK